MTIHLILLFVGVMVMIPFFWMISTALKIHKQVYAFPPIWIPHPVAWYNFVEGWLSAPFTRFLGNTCIVIAGAVSGVIIAASLVAYGFARLRFPGRDIIFLVVLSTLMLPPQVTMIPLYIFFRDLGWLDTFKPLIVPAWFGGGAFNIFLLRQFLKTIPVEMEDAAKIDGCGVLRIFFHIMLPLSKPALGVISIMSFTAHWKDFMQPLIYLHSYHKSTLSLGLWHYSQALHQHPGMNLLMAVSLLSTIPLLVVFFFAQKYFIQGIVITGVKG